MSTRAKTLLKSLWWVLVLLFISLFLYRNLGTAASVISRLPLGTLALAFAAILLAKLLLAEVMRRALARFGIHFPYPDCFRMYNLTQLGKYIPGSVWQFLGRIALYRERGLNNRTIKDTLLLETFWVVFSAFAIGLLLVLIMQRTLIGSLLSQLPDYLTHPATLVGTGLILLSLLILWRKPLWVYARAYRFDTEILFVAVLIWLCLGFSFWITLLPILDAQPAFLYIVGLYALSYAVGFVVPFAPAGIGIREAVLVTGLLPFLDTGSAVVLATLNRLGYILAEILLVAFIGMKPNKRTKDPVHP
ncbi:MAG: lysylphosphatidylglycerol synthase domain-containing protein [Candidatus Thiodiazotropha sp.]